MAIPLDTDLYHVTANIQLKPKYRQNVVTLGDGYKNRSIDGINYEEEVWNMEFLPQIASVAITLKELLLNSVNGAGNVLSWTPLPESTMKYWVATEILMRPTKSNKWKISCILTREYIATT